MNYELAKKLKEAGFPQYMPYVAVCSKCLVKIQRTHKNSLKVQIHECKKGGENLVLHIPTLSELIEACGEDFYKLWQSNVWRAKALILSPSEDLLSRHGEGSTPEEAVANLWLELKRNEE